MVATIEAKTACNTLSLQHIDHSHYDSTNYSSSKEINYNGAAIANTFKDDYSGVETNINKPHI